MENKPKISVIIPVYNTEEYVERCLETVLNQSYNNIEIIIVNDGSNDLSHNIISKIIQNHQNINYIQLEHNIGVGNARNCGIQNAHGEYIGFVDSDDWVDSSFYEQLLNSILSYNADIAVAGIRTEIEDVSHPRNRYTYPKPSVLQGKFALHALVNMYNSDIKITPIVNNKLYKKSLIRDNHILFDKSRRAQDNYFSFMALMYSSRTVLVNNTFYHYYQRPSSITHDVSNGYIDDYIYVLTDLKQTLENRKMFDEYSQEFTACVMRCFNAMINNLFSQEQDSRTQKKRIIYILKKMSDVLPWSILIEKIDIERFRRFWEP